MYPVILGWLVHNGLHMFNKPQYNLMGKALHFQETVEDFPISKSVFLLLAGKKYLFHAVMNG